MDGTHGWWYLLVPILLTTLKTLCVVTDISYCGLTSIAKIQKQMQVRTEGTLL